MSVPYAAACKGCGYVEQFAYDKDPASPLRGTRTTTPLTPQGHVPVVCPSCGAQGQWRVPATAEDLAKWEAKKQREVRAVELCRTVNVDGLLKIPEEIRAAPEVKNALSNLFAPLEGAVLQAAVQNCLRVAKSGVAVAADVWIDLYDRAVAKAVKDVKDAKAVKAA